MPITKRNEFISIIQRKFCFPALKQELIEQAIKYGVRQEMINILEHLPDREYTSAEDLYNEWKTNNF